ncbi:hypothetical protein Vadar_018826 [Vaccinium darrowii]|uniref:Uncharacterized protein n=1 Tax=Vaccinium darrowii TaxID=229202 RepID=A0ACB7XSM4_9ERIC|nr:hypothetical protein Vadar_018826 [Vaccinium darrowii]
MMTNLTYASRTCKVAFSGGSEYEVNDDGVTYTVNLAQWVCLCKVWQISGLPCKHALACCTYSRLNFVDYIHPYYSKEMYLAPYGRIIHPIMDHTMWTEVLGDVLQPPPLRRQMGRPRKNRRREESEAPPIPDGGKRSHTLRCAKCKEFGHYRRTCQGGPVRGRGGGNNNAGMGRARSGHTGSGGNAIAWTEVDVQIVWREEGGTLHYRGEEAQSEEDQGGVVQYLGNEGRRDYNMANPQGTQPSQCVTQVTHPSQWSFKGSKWRPDYNITKTMPVLNLSTNVNLDGIVTSDFLKEATSSVANVLGKPEYVMILLKGSIPISYGGTDQPAAYGELVSIGSLNPDINKQLAAAISTVLETRLSVPRALILATMDPP